jgi:hypothetical protein
MFAQAADAVGGVLARAKTAPASWQPTLTNPNRKAVIRELNIEKSLVWQARETNDTNRSQILGLRRRDSTHGPRIIKVLDAVSPTLS